MHALARPRAAAAAAAPACRRCRRAPPVVRVAAAAAATRARSPSPSPSPSPRRGRPFSSSEESSEEEDDSHARRRRDGLFGFLPLFLSASPADDDRMPLQELRAELRHKRRRLETSRMMSGSKFVEAVKAFAKAERGVLRVLTAVPRKWAHEWGRRPVQPVQPVQPPGAADAVGDGYDSSDHDVHDAAQ